MKSSSEISLVDPGFWKGKTVLLTGHTGFKGGWMSVWLHSFGAKLYGISLTPDMNPSLFESANLHELFEESHLHPIEDFEFLDELVKRISPDVIIHMAAQPLVRKSYDEPRETFMTNVMGTVNVLEASKNLSRSSVCLVITTDKCYYNDGSGRHFKETDPIGGDDPYSASKGACEIAVNSWIKSFFSMPNSPVVASARAGNVIGGGDWSENRLIPDAVKAFSQNEALVIRNPIATRPWQHVLEPLSGYLVLCQKLASDRELQRHWNFGPIPSTHVSVYEVAELVAKTWGGNASFEIIGSKQDWHEASTLSLDSSNAFSILSWIPILEFNQGVIWATDWYRDYYTNGALSYKLLQMQIARYMEHARGLKDSNVNFKK